MNNFQEQLFQKFSSIKIDAMGDVMLDIKDTEMTNDLCNEDQH